MGFEDAYDDSAILEGKIKNCKIIQKNNKIEENKNNSEEGSENKNRPISNNDTEHLNPSQDYFSVKEMIQNIDVSTNTNILSNDIDKLQEKADRYVEMPLKKSIATNTSKNSTPIVNEKMNIKDPLNYIMDDLEKDPQFINELSVIIGERLKKKAGTVVQTRGNTTIDEHADIKEVNKDSKSTGKYSIYFVHIKLIIS